jgi:Ni/Fe-hydrogenase subunit HybB-like protein
MNISLPKPTFWRIVLVGVLVGGLYSTYLRFFYGLGAATNLSDQFPWGLWIGFDVLCGVALAGGGFTISAIVYIFHIERFRPIIRPTILTAFLGYTLVVVAIMFDLGRSDRIWHPIIMWNPHSVMFEVGWCVMLYSTVLALEFSPAVFQKLGWAKPLKVVKSLMILLVIAGVVLSSLHQSSLGSLYLIVPGKLYPLWYSPLLPYFFFISAVALGCAMTIFESFLSFRAFGRRLELPLLSDLGKVIVWVLSIFLVLRVQDLMHRGVVSLALGNNYEARLFQAEIILGVIAPIIFLAIPKIRQNQLGLFVSSLMVITGFIFNRLNVSITGMERAAGFSYMPSLSEAAVTLSIVGIGCLIFALAVRYLDIFPEASPEDLTDELPAVAQLSRSTFGTTRWVLAGAAAIFMLALGLAWDGVGKRGPENAVGNTATQQVSIQTDAPVQP